MCLDDIPKVVILPEICCSGHDLLVVGRRIPYDSIHAPGWKRSNWAIDNLIACCRIGSVKHVARPVDFETKENSSIGTSRHLEMMRATFLKMSLLRDWLGYIVTGDRCLDNLYLFKWVVLLAAETDAHIYDSSTNLSSSQFRPLMLNLLPGCQPQGSGGSDEDESFYRWDQSPALEPLHPGLSHYKYI